MASRGRGGGGRYVEYVSDDEESYYEEYPAPKQTLRPAPSPARRKLYHHAHSYASSGPRYAAEPDNIIVENHLNIPQVARPRASSQGAQPQPNLLYVQSSSRDPSRERRRRYDSDSSSDGHHSRRSHRKHKDSIDAETAIRLAKLELLEAQNKKGYADSGLEAKLARLELQEEMRREQQKSKYADSETYKLKEWEQRRHQETEEQAILARMEERERKEKQREKSYLLEYQERQRKEEEAEAAAIAHAEQKRVKREAERREEQDKYQASLKDKADKEKAERERIIADQREKDRRKKEEAEEERKQIILEEELRKKKEKEKHEALRKQILAEEEEKIAKEKAKKKHEEEEFQMKVKERFMKAGYSPDFVEDIIENKRKDLRRSGSHRSTNQLAIEMNRPTYIRIRLEHLYPETLDAYQLPWDYDPTDNKYILIKEYISHELQQELFEHTRKIKIKRERLLITDGFTKDTITTLKPGNVYKDKSSDEMYMVRKKSVSKSPARRSWMFT